MAADTPASGTTTGHAVGTLQCGKCGQPMGQLVVNSTVCPSCLMSDTLADLEPADHRALSQMAHSGRSPSAEHLNAELPKFDFRELIGRGGSGWVYLAEQKSLGRLVAVKILRRRSADRATADERFMEEARTLAKLNHPNVVTVHDYGATDEHRYLVMEYVAGPSLRDRLRSGTVEVEEALRIAMLICQAVDFAHTSGIVHRDLKPENVLFVSDEQAAELKVADFGIAKLSGQQPTPDYTATGVVVGTPFYMAPERHTAMGTASASSDVYSIGVMLYEMIYRKLPLGYLAANQNQPGVSGEIQQVILRSLASEPNDRFATAGELAEALGRCLQRSSQRAELPHRTAAIALLLGLLCAATIVAGMTLPWGNRVNASLNEGQTNGDGPRATDQPAEKSIAGESTEPHAEIPEMPSGEDAPTSVAQVGDASFSPELAMPVANSGGSAYDVVLSNVRVRRQGFDVQLRFDLKFREPVQDAPESTYYWVFESSHGGRREMLVPDLGGRTEISIEKQFQRMHGPMWPAELYIVERWQKPEVGQRRVSDVHRIEHRHLLPVGW